MGFCIVLYMSMMRCYIRCGYGSVLIKCGLDDTRVLYLKLIGNIMKTLHSFPSSRAPATTTIDLLLLGQKGPLQYL